MSVSFLTEQQAKRLGLAKQRTFHSRDRVLTADLLRWATKGFEGGPYYRFVDRHTSEENFQVELLQTLYGITTPDFEAIHVPNGGHRMKSAAARMKRLGARSGVADLFCGWKSGSCWLELKSSKGKSELSQKEFGKWVISTGGNYFVVHAIAQTIGKLLSVGAPIRQEFAGIARLELRR